LIPAFILHPSLINSAKASDEMQPVPGGVFETTRQISILSPECFIASDNPVGVIVMFVEQLDLGGA
jgi:hypothetical protein